MRLLCFAACAVTALSASAQPKTYTDTRKHSITLPLGDLSFADEVVSFTPGKPAAAPEYSSAAAVLSPPDHDPRDRKDRNYVTLGCGGQLVLRFADNALVDVKGPDLYVFEIGPQVEATLLSISTNGTEWKEVGKISGGTAMVDISGMGAPGETYPYVRLTDPRQRGCGGQFPGADLDAVAAIGAGLRLSLKSSVLFEFGKSDLKAEAKAELDGVARKLGEYPGARIIIEGHTDSVGAADANQKLSERRAEAVRKHLEAVKAAGAMETRGYGATRPVAPNTTEEARERNRRVELIVIPAPPT
jgi:outer membrane protein OmpA-like peptidoglycan-associated protein